MCYLWRDLPLVILKLYSMYLERSKSKSRTRNLEFWNGTGTVNKYNLSFLNFSAWRELRWAWGIQNFWQNQTKRRQDQIWGSKFVFKQAINAFAYPTRCTKIKPNTAILSSKVSCVILDVYVTDHLFLLKDNCLSQWKLGLLKNTNEGKIPTPALCCDLNIPFQGKGTAKRAELPSVNTKAVQKQIFF